MKKQVSVIIIMAIAAGLFGGCAEYHQDCYLLVVSEPTEAEIWKGDYYLGKTPRLLCFTATKEDKKKGSLAVPPLIIKKEDYQSQAVAAEIDLDGGSKWECRVVLEPLPE